MAPRPIPIKEYIEPFRRSNATLIRRITKPNKTIPPLIY